MIKNDDRSLSIGVLTCVIVAHLAIFFGIRLLNRPELPIEPPGLSFVDLGMMGGGEAGSGDGQTAPPTEPTPPQPQPQPPKPVPTPPEPKPQPRETVKPVVRNDAVKPDVIVPREEPKPQPRPIEPVKPIEPIKPVQPQAAETPVSPINNSATPSDKPAGRTGGNQQAGSGQGGNAAGSGGGTGGGQGDGGGGSGGGGDGTGGGEFVAASHVGGYLNNPKPPYPPQLLEDGVNGSVRLRVMVEANGKPSSVEVISATHPLFRRSAEETVRNQYTFRPATRGGQPIRHSYTFTIRFNAPR